MAKMETSERPAAPGASQEGFVPSPEGGELCHLGGDRPPAEGTRPLARSGGESAPPPGGSALKNEQNTIPCWVVAPTEWRLLNTRVWSYFL